MRIEILKDGAVVNTIIADEAFAELVHPGAWRVAAEPPPAPPVELPTVAITAIAVDEAHADRAQIASDFSSMKLPVGAVVTITAELQMLGQRVPGFVAEFAMPMRSTDGSMRHLAVGFEDGVAVFSAAMSDSKRWEVTQALVNSDLPPEMHMSFAGITITAVE